MKDRFKFRIPMFTDKGSFIEFQYLELGDYIETTLCGYNGEPQQCTGLKDKNGKLIYESDIVKYEDEVYGLCIGRIEWDNAHYELQYYTGEKYGWFSHILCLKHIKNIEVIGNIYENEELLDERKRSI